MYCICLTTPLSNKKKIRVKRRKNLENHQVLIIFVHLIRNYNIS